MLYLSTRKSCVYDTLTDTDKRRHEEYRKG